LLALAHFLGEYVCSHMNHLKIARSHLFRPQEPEELKVPEPDYIRLPRAPAHCPYTGLSKTTLDMLTRPQKLNDFNPPVKSKLLQQTGAVRSLRLIDYHSLKQYLASLPDGNRRAIKP
jgi:hypothetical protein